MKELFRSGEKVSDISSIQDTGETNDIEVFGQKDPISSHPIYEMELPIDLVLGMGDQFEIHDGEKVSQIFFLTGGSNPTFCYQ